MSTRSRDAQLLGRLLTHHTGRPVKVTYHGASRDRHGGWHVEWTDGLTVVSMQKLATKLSAAHSIRCPIRDYRRASTDLAEACALLRKLEAEPESAVRVGSVMVEAAHHETDHPEVADEQGKDRAGALLSLSPHRRLELDVLDQIAERAIRGGFRAVLEWLDGISAGVAHPDVVDLAEARRRREQER